jgi:hypothetical protein
LPEVKAAQDSSEALVIDDYREDPFGTDQEFYTYPDV